MIDVSTLPVYAQQALAHALGNDPSSIEIQCEAPDCQARKTLSQMCSMAAVYRMPGGDLPAYQCPVEQHYGCCHEHAILAMLKCLVTDIEAGGHIDAKQGKYNHPLLQHIEQEIQALAQAS